jgi:ABC-type multidrug transport system fused ATPase/permease subunit
MKNLVKKINFTKDYKIVIVFIAISIFCMVCSLCWQFWLLLEVSLCVIAVIYFSKRFHDLLNIHAVIIGLIVLYSIPSTVLILQGKIELSADERLVLFSSICIGLFAYTMGALFLKKTVFFEKRKNTKLSKRINKLFWLTYRYRYVLTFILCTILIWQGFTPRGMSYTESVNYRMKITGVIIYLNSLSSTIFSALLIGMICIVGDLKKYRKLSFLSYILIVLIILSIIGGHRIWIVGLFACLLLSFKPYLKRRQLLTIVVLAFFLTFLLSGAVRFARTGKTFTENIKNFYEYSLTIKNKTFKNVMWKWSAFSTPFSTFIALIKNIPQKVDFEYDAYIKDLSLLVPTVIYPKRPLPYNKWYVKTFKPKLFERGAGETFYILGFGYLFFGVIGVFVTFFLFGILFEWLNKTFEMIGGAAGLFLYSYFFVELLRFIVGYGFIAFIKTSIILNFLIPISLLFLFVIILDSLSLKRKEYKSEKRIF